MGWLWASSPKKGSSPADDSAATSTKVAPNEPNIDPEIQKFLDLFSSESSSKPEVAKPSTSSSSPSSSSPQPDNEKSSSSSWFSLKASRTASEDPLPNAPRRDALSESLLPTEMSCRQAFDLAWSCNSLGGQWNAVYRNGEMRSCSDHWDDFWFCMRYKSTTGPAKEEAIREHYRNREYNKYYAPGRHSSEDIWRPRGERLPPGSAFSQSIDVPTVSDEEWRRAENQRRQEVRQSLDLDKTASS